MRTMVVASVFEPAGFAVSLIRITSPPTLLGRKLLKNCATRNDPSNRRAGTATCCALRRIHHRHVDTRTLTRKMAIAISSHDTDAPRAICQRRPASIREKSSASSATLTASFAASRRWRRTEEGDSGVVIGDVGFASASNSRIAKPESRSQADPSGTGRRRHCTTFSCENHTTVRILMIAPEPFFEPRGTPFSEFHRIRALTALGHEVDLVTYPFGQDVAMPGLRVFRSLRPPFVDHVKIGPSLAKLPLDAFLTLTAIRRALSGRYDAIHSHEEGGLIGALLAPLVGVPHLYDMHSSLPQQLTNFAFSRSALVRRVFFAIERLMIRRSRVVIVICPSLEDTVRAIEPRAQTVLIENAPGSAEDVATPAQAAEVRRSLGLGASTPIVLYTGTFEAYQGL